MSDAPSPRGAAPVAAPGTGADAQTGATSNTSVSFAALKQAFSALAVPTFRFRVNGSAPAAADRTPDITPAFALPEHAESPPTPPRSVQGISALTSRLDADFYGIDDTPDITPARTIAEAPAEPYVPVAPSHSVWSDYSVALDETMEENGPGTNEMTVAGTDVPFNQLFGGDTDLLDESDEWDWETDFATGVHKSVAAAQRRQVRSFKSRTSRETWLYHEGIPRLLAINAERGFISLCQLARALQTIDRDDRLCKALIQALDHDDIRVTRSVAHSREGGVPTEDAERIFASMLMRPPYPRDVLCYLKMDHLPLSPETINFVTTVFEMHRLTLNTETALLRRLVAARTPGRPHSARATDPEAWQALFDDNLWLVCRMAAKHVGHGLEIEDLIQEGCLGLMAGLEHYQPGKVPRLVHYLPNWIFQRITRAIADEGRLIRLPVHIYDEMYTKVSATVESYVEEHGEPPTSAWCSDYLDIPQVAVERVFAYLRRPTSLDVMSPAKQDIVMRHCMHLSNDYDQVLDEADGRALRDAVRRVLSTLALRERQVLFLRFGLRDGRKQTLEEVGRELGVTRERARQIEDQALKDIRHYTKSRYLRDWYPLDPRPPHGASTAKDAKGRKAGAARPGGRRRTSSTQIPERLQETLRRLQDRSGTW